MSQGNVVSGKDIDWILISALPFPSCVTPDKSPDLGVSQLLIWKSRNAEYLPHGTFERLNGIVHVKCWSQCLVHSGCISIGIALAAALRC